MLGEERPRSRLIELTERYFVIYQTLTDPPTVELGGRPYPPEASRLPIPAQSCRPGASGVSREPLHESARKCDIG